MTFKESADRSALNRQLWRGTAIDVAEMADGSLGIVVRYGRGILVLNEKEALAFANSIVDTLERHAQVD